MTNQVERLFKEFRQAASQYKRCGDENCRKKMEKAHQAFKTYTCEVA